MGGTDHASNYAPVLHDFRRFLTDVVNSVPPPDTVGTQRLHGDAGVVRKVRVYERSGCLGVTIPLVDVTDSSRHFLIHPHVRQ